MPLTANSAILRASILAVATLSAIAVAAQVRRVAIGNSSVSAVSSPVSGDYMEVYEYDVVDFQPQFPGGDCALLKFINSERRYPSDAYQRRIEGRVLCSFVVNTDGTISHITVMRGVDDSLDREAIRIIDRMPRWEAGRMGHRPVPVYCILPIPFRL